MKIVVAHNRYAAASPSGENIIVDAEIAQLRAAGVTVVPFLRSSDEIGDLPAAQQALLPLSPIYNRASQQALADLLRAEQPDVLHLHNPYPLLSPWVVRTAHKHGVPVIQTVHNYRQVCAPGLYFRDGHVCHDCRGKVFGLPAVQHACYRGSRAQSAIMAATLAVHRGTWRSVDRYIALTSAIADHLRDYGIPADRISVKPNAIPDPWPTLATPGSAGPAGPAGRGFLFAARLSPEKGLGLLLDAWRGYAEGELGTLRIAGDGPLRPLAESVAASRADVTYLGPLDRAATLAQIAAAACVVAPSVWHDVLPTIVLEALACGRPVLGTTMGGIPYLVGDAGWVVEPEPVAVSAGLKAAHAGAARLATTARQRYEESFAPDVLVQRLIDIYEEVAT
ncbi:glycosyltransferase [Planosporangium flavigriseum]|uniref:glycosyltransferase n=1 Tax=Planosporangium flavigriseum TaxID=373681 RepID=UPI00143ACD7C|nr:glycosyltransferase [Planosporangium flavigriseum]NJC64560.1 glycosyltransferase [Planosporangium flavigriseum]